MILVLSGSSSCGKNTIINELVNNDNGIKYIQTYTSREMRSGESNGNPYFFISKNEFQAKIKNNDFFEYELIHNNFYGVERNLCLDLLENNTHLLKDMGVLGTFNLKEELNDKLVETVFLYVNKKTLAKRLTLRGDSEEQIKLRLKRFNFEKASIKNYNFVIHNYNKENTIKILTKMLEFNAEYYNYINYTKELKLIKKSKIEKYKNKLINNKNFRPLKVYFDGENFVLKDRIELYLAGVLLNKTITKNVIIKNKKVNFKTSSNELLEFLDKNK